MKKSKIIIPALAMLVMSTAATVTGTVAWFTMNTTATAEGMMLGAKTNGSLIIKEIVDGGDLPLATDRATKVLFNSESHKFYPSTHDLSIGTDTGLRRVNNGMDVNFETGTAMNSGTTLNYVAVADNSADYYFDYGIMVAGDGLAMESQVLSISISLGSASISNAMYNALSIDFYGAPISGSAALPAISEANFLGTLNLAGKQNTMSTVDGVSRPTGAVTTGHTLVNSKYTTYVDEDTGNTMQAGITIPKSGTDAAYAIRMRAYFDGELIETPGTGFYASYTSCGTGTVAGNEGYLFYTENGESIVDAKVNDATDNLWKVASGSTKTYARSKDFGEFNDQKINVTISATSYAPTVVSNNP